MIHNYDHNFPTLSTNSILNNSISDDLESKMKTQYFDLWKNILSKSPKLSFYQTFKEYYEEEHYLNTLSIFDERKQLSQLRISNHKLAIETGRYTYTKNTT